MDRAEPQLQGVYGAPLLELAAPAPGAVQLSPLHPGATALESLSDESLAGAVALAPPGTVERRYVLAQLLRATAPGAPLTLLAPKARGGARVKAELEAFGCAVVEDARRHHRIARLRRPAAPADLEAAIAAGGPQRVETLGLWSQPGVFSWNRLDPGTAALLAALPPPAGRGADLGCGVGALALAALASPAVSALLLVDLDRRAVEAARRNVEDPRARFAWADLRGEPVAAELDFVVMNPPFHDGGAEDRALGQAFIRAAHRMLRRGGSAWLVANRHLPYERPLADTFAAVALRGEAGGYKVFEARR